MPKAREILSTSISCLLGIDGRNLTLISLMKNQVDN